MTEDKQIRLLEAQIDKIDALSQAEDHEAYKAWHMQTELLLKQAFGKDASEVLEFGRLDALPGVYTAGNKALNDQRTTEAYFSDLKRGRSLLTGILEFLKATNDADTDSKPVDVGSLEALHDKVKEKCSGLYLGEYYPEAVEKGFKVVRDRLRELTTYETGSEAFGKTGLFIKGASAKNVEKDFQAAVKFLTMAIDQFRNEKSHTSDGKIEDPVRAYEYLALSSLAMHLLDDSEVREVKSEEPRNSKQSKQTAKPAVDEKLVQLDPLQVLAMKLFGAMTSYKELMIYRTSGGDMIHAMGDINSDSKLLEELKGVDTQEFEANLEEMASWGLVTISYNSSGYPKYKLAKPGYDLLKEHPELNAT